MINVVTFEEKPEFIPVDDWQPNEEDLIFKHTKGAMILPVSLFYGITNDVNTLDYFVLSTKRCYNSDEVRDHISHYMNYFIKFYDRDNELLSVYCKLKYMIDYEDSYTEEVFKNDIQRYILNSMIANKVKRMNRDNYMLKLKYINLKNPGLQYNEAHASVLMEMSLFMNMLIPLLTHFIHIKKIDNIKHFLLSVFDYILHMHEDVDIYNKLYETAISNVNKNRDYHSTLWNMQSIRGRDTVTHTLSTVTNLILQLMPKYTYSKNIISLNFIAIQKDIGYKIVDISYEYAFVSLSSSKRDDDQNNEFDKYEAFLTKTDESLYLQNKVNCEEAMKNITRMYGPFDSDEIKFYMDKLSKNSRIVINGFQKNLIFNLFYKYFGDPTSIKAINSEDYIKLIIAARKILEVNNMVMLPYIISSKVNKLVERKNINKKELTKLEGSSKYKYIKDKYKNDKITKQILSIIAAILSSEFEIIDYYNDELDGMKIEIESDYILEEVMTYIGLI